LLLSTYLFSLNPLLLQVSPLVQKIQNDILFDSLLKSPSKQAVSLAPALTPAPSAPGPKAADKQPREAERRGAKAKEAGARPKAGEAKAKAGEAKAKAVEAKAKVVEAKAAAAPHTSPMAARAGPSPSKTPRVVAPWRHQVAALQDLTFTFV
jgi:hypothetical protein